MQTASRVVMSIVALLAGSQAWACSCAEFLDVAAQLARSDDVVLARVKAATLTPHAGDPSGRWVDEEATLEVLEVFKGSHQPGDIITVRSELGPGACERSVENKPRWIDSVDSEGNPIDVEISDVWLLYRPSDTSNCGRSMPAEMAAKDLAALRALSRRPSARSK